MVILNFIGGYLLIGCLFGFGFFLRGYCVIAPEAEGAPLIVRADVDAGGDCVVAAFGLEMAAQSKPRPKSKPKLKHFRTKPPLISPKIRP